LAEHSASAETVLEVIRSLEGDTDPKATRMLPTLEVACWRIWGCLWPELENRSPERNSDCISLTWTTALLLHEPFISGSPIGL